MWNEDENASQIRAVSKIKTGEEITLTYNWKQLAMKNRQTRHCAQIYKEFTKFFFAILSRIS